MAASKKKKQFSIGLDLGGTKLAAGLVDEAGNLIDEIKIPVEMNRENSAILTQKRVLSLMADISLDFKRRFPKECSAPYFAGIGLASAGPLNTKTGQLIHPVNYPGWKVVPIRDNLSTELKKRNFNTTVKFQNDAIAAALAEGWVGGARGLETFVVVTVGTGIGSGVIVHGQPCHTQGMGSEFGHLLVNLANVQKNPKLLDDFTVEGIASGTGLLRRAHQMGFKGSSVESLVMALEGGAKEYKILFDDMAWALAALCFNLSIGFRVEKILISGGLLKIKHLFLPALKKNYHQLVTGSYRAFKAPVQIAQGGTHAGVVGAAYLPYIK
jgi:glucokinase